MIYYKHKELQCLQNDYLNIKNKKYLNVMKDSIFVEEFLFLILLLFDSYIFGLKDEFDLEKKYLLDKI